MTAVRRATVFDLDDTLIHTAEAWPHACALFTAGHGHRWSDQDSAALHGNGHWVAYVAGLCGGSAGPAEVVAATTETMVAACAAGRIEPLPGAVELLDAAARHGPVAVATASPRAFVLPALRQLGPSAARLGAVVCGEDVTRAKPAPDPYLRAAACLGIDPALCTAVEDSPAGIRSAAAAGMRVLAIPRPGAVLPTDVAALTTAQARTAAEALPLLTRLLTAGDLPVGEQLPAAAGIGG
jgi:HAD superfamily hydrolase (TIGR01509 family)